MPSESSVEPALLDPVAGSFHCGMGHALVGKPGQVLVQRDRIRGRQATIVGDPGRNDANGADACRLVPGCRPDLPQKRGNRSLAGRAGHCRHGFRLIGEKPRRKDR